MEITNWTRQQNSLASQGLRKTCRDGLACRRRNEVSWANSIQQRIRMRPLGSTNHRQLNSICISYIYTRTAIFYTLIKSGDELCGCLLDMLSTASMNHDRIKRVSREEYMSLFPMPSTARLVQDTIFPTAAILQETAVVGKKPCTAPFFKQLGLAQRSIPRGDGSPTSPLPANHPGS